MTYKLIGGLLLSTGVFGLFSIFDIWQQFFGLSFSNEFLAYAGVAAIAAGAILWSLQSNEIEVRR